MKLSWPAGEEISTLHNGIIKENRLNKACTFNPHRFPSFGATVVEKIPCNPDAKFERFNDNSLKDISPKKDSGPDIEEILRLQIEAAEKIAYEMGYNQGVSEGRKTGEKTIEPVLTKFEKALSELERIKQNLSHMAEVEAVNLSLAIAKKIVGNEISINKNVILNIVKEALKKVDGHENIKIKVNPLEFQIIEESRNELKKITNCMENIEIIADHEISQGGCVIETNIGDIDARIEKQFKVVEDAFKVDYR